MAEFAPIIRALDETEALTWLRTQPDGRTNLAAAEHGRRWGWIAAITLLLGPFAAVSLRGGC